MPKRLNRAFSWLSYWYVWLFPVIALGVAGWLFRGYLEKRGPEIDIAFDEASAITAEKTHVRYRGVDIGVVKEIHLASDDKSVIARVRLQKDAAHFAVAGSRFWIVSPKVGLSGITGLETIFEGTYIAVQPGDPNGDQRTDFKGHMTSDMNPALENTRPFVLEAPNVESVTPNDAVTFRGMNVGTVASVALNKTGQLGIVQVNIQNKYAHLVRTNTVFWRKVGVQAKLGLFGAEVKVNSVDSILHGGVEFFTPDNPGPVAKSLTRFTLEAAAPKGSEKWNPKLDETRLR